VNKTIDQERVLERRNKLKNSIPVIRALTAPVNLNLFLLSREKIFLLTEPMHQTRISTHICLITTEICRSEKTDF
jgi:hypothetical protein